MDKDTVCCFLVTIAIKFEFMSIRIHVNLVCQSMGRSQRNPSTTAGKESYQSTRERKATAISFYCVLTLYERLQNKYVQYCTIKCKNLLLVRTVDGWMGNEWCVLIVTVWSPFSLFRVTAENPTDSRDRYLSARNRGKAFAINSSSSSSSDRKYYCDNRRVQCLYVWYAERNHSSLVLLLLFYDGSLFQVDILMLMY